MLLSQPLPQSLASSSFRIKDPVGREIAIPCSSDEDAPYFKLSQRDEIVRYYRDNGYVVIRDLVPREQCEAARRSFDREVKPYKGFIYRQATANPERHDFTRNGMMLNPILNIQSLDQRRFPDFLGSGLAILTHPRTQRVVQSLLGAPGKLVQSMYFDGNPATWAHQDTYYLDAEEIGGMAAGWFAVDDIAPGAGRFFVCPTSHQLDMAKNGGDFDVAFNHDRYKGLVLDVIRRHGLEFRAPALNQGDALFWSSKTIHGSLETTQPERARSSFTAHYIPESSRLLQFQSRFRGLNVERINGMPVHKPKDLSRLSSRAVFWIETTFPATFQKTKKLAIKALTR